MMKKFFLPMLMLMLSCVQGAWAASNLLERTLEGSSNDKNPVSAKSAMISQITEKISEELIKEIIGESKYVRNKQIITSKIIKQSSRFIPFSKPGELQAQTPEGFKMSLTVKINVDDLQTFLLENGLFYDNDGTPIVLPAIEISDRIHGRTQAWWSNTDNSNKTFLIKEGKDLEESLRSSFSKNNFYLLRPMDFKLGDILPVSLRSESLSSEDWQRISQRLGAPILIRGELGISKSEERSDAFAINIKLTAIQVMNGRVVADVARNYETEGGVFEVVVGRKFKEIFEGVGQDLASQVLEAWQKGSLGSSLYKLTIRGQLPLLQQEVFKEVLKNKIREIKNVRERLISQDSLVFEVDSALSPKELGQRSPQIEVGNFRLSLESSSETEIVYNVKRMN